MLKILIVVLFAAVVVSLFSGLAFLFKDNVNSSVPLAEGNKTRRTLYALGLRITLAAVLMLTIFYGFYSGELNIGKNAPWHERSSAAPGNPPSPESVW